MVFDCWTAVLHRGAAVVFLWGGVVITHAYLAKYLIARRSECAIRRIPLSLG